MVDVKKLNKNKRQDINSHPSPNLVDIRYIQIDMDLPAFERLEKYLQDIQHPYQFLCGHVTVHVCFSDEGNDLSTQLKNYFSSYHH